jgi:SAM-dependent methyltransferase
MASSTNLFFLYLLRFKTLFLSWIDYIYSVFHYYSNPSYRKADLELVSAYLVRNPYTLSRKFLEEKGTAQIHAYGETPIMTLQKIVKECSITPQDTIYELGSGRGRACFWLRLVLGAKVFGIDFVPEFIEIAEKIRKSQKIENLKFRCEDFLKSDLHKATIIYLHGSCMEDLDIEKLNRHLIRLKRGLKVITVSFSMADYDEGNHWNVIKVFPAKMSWGSADVYLQILS